MALGGRKNIKIKFARLIVLYYICYHMTLKEFIKKWGISQREIANKSGLSFGSFHNKLFENSTMPGYVTKFTESDKKTIAATFKEMKNDLKNLDL